MERKVVKLKNGESISYFEQGTGSKTLVLIHGNTSSSVYFKPLFERFDSNIRVIAPDLRGFGNSSYINRFDSLKELAEDIDELLLALNVGEFSLLGWSLGGGVSMELALLNNNVKNLILVASTTHKGYPLYQKDENNEQMIAEAESERQRLLSELTRLKDSLVPNQEYSSLTYIDENLKALQEERARLLD